MRWVRPIPAKAWCRNRGHRTYGEQCAKRDAADNLTEIRPSNPRTNHAGPNADTNVSIYVDVSMHVDVPMNIDVSMRVDVSMRADVSVATATGRARHR